MTTASFWQDMPYNAPRVSATFTNLGGPGIPGDVDNDGLVGTSDLLLLLGAWGTCPPKGACAADLDGDGIVGTTDLLILLGNWS